MDLSRAATYEVQTNSIVLTMYRRIYLVYSYVRSTDHYYSTDYVQTDMRGIVFLKEKANVSVQAYHEKISLMGERVKGKRA